MSDCLTIRFILSDDVIISEEAIFFLQCEMRWGRFAEYPASKDIQLGHQGTESYLSTLLMKCCKKPIML